MNLRIAVVLMLSAVIAVSWGASCVIFRAAQVGERVSPLEPRTFAHLTVITVGTGGSYEDPERLGPATAIGWGTHLVMVDAGRGIAEALRSSGLPVSQPEKVFLTNLLPENTTGLDDLLLTGWLTGREKPLQIIGPPGTEELVEGLTRAHRGAVEAQAEALDLPLGGARLEALEVGDGWSLELDGARIRAGALSGGPIPALAWRFERSGRSAVVSGTGWGTDELIALAKNAQLLVHEAVYIPPTEDLEEAGVTADPERLRRESAIHTSLLDVGGLAQRARVESLALVRLRPPPFFKLQVTSMLGDSYRGRVLVPDDGDEIAP